MPDPNSFMDIHTHSRQRNLHPHLHIIVASGRYNKTRNQWHKGIIDTSNNTVTFKYKDGQTQAVKNRILPVLLFLWLILQHVLLKGLQRVRNYGFSHGNAKRLRVRVRVRIQAILLHLFNWKMPLLSAITPSKAIRIFLCCQHEMKCVGIT
ncbi:transposase [Moritella sp.]|uniref:transposase n=1 Tax=Moritella sp. TaxID=78556 RepID=UPI0025EB7826|nr:transposase [Moritella sp.]